MHRYYQFGLAGLTAVALIAACEDSTTRNTSRPSITDPSFTVASNFASSVVGRGNAGAFHIRSTDGFDVEIKSKDNTDIAVGSVVAAPGGSSGWHSHPGPVLVIVKTGAITFYRAGGHSGQGFDDAADNGNGPSCTRTVYPAGSAFVEVPAPGHVMLARNEGTVDATVSAVYFAPPGAALRIDQPAPGGNCPAN
ncbi:MAG TPA: hypothetical protein VGD02_08900 [Gemmatimonadaceae bacterium]